LGQIIADNNQVAALTAAEFPDRWTIWNFLGFSDRVGHATCTFALRPDILNQRKE